MGKKYNFNLNKDSKKELREKLDELLDTITFDPNKRIKLPKSTLELIMFDYDSKREYRKVGFYSNNLCKLDLSELSFKNVFLGDTGVKNFNNTNIKLNLGECHLIRDDFMDKDSLYLLNISLHNVDLSDNDFHELYSNYGISDVDFVNCNLSNTGLRIYYLDQYTNPNIEFSNCNLTKMDLSQLIVSSQDKTILGTLKANCNTTFSGGNNFYGTKIRFNVSDIRELKALELDFSGLNPPVDKFKGCYFSFFVGDSAYIRTDEENVENKANINKKYKKFVNKKEKQIIKIIRQAIDDRYKDNPEELKYDTTHDEFRLNKEAKDKIRQAVSIILERVHYNSDARLKIPKNLLEELLFDYHYDVNEVFYKTIGFTDHCIDRFDFSEVDFEDTTFDYVKEFKESKKMIFLAGTNAKIDFTKTYEYKTGQPVYVRYAYLGGVDLSNNNFRKHGKKKKITFVMCDLRDTKIKIPETANADFLFCDLQGNDLSNIRLDLYDMVCIFNNGLQFNDCDLKDTGIRFIAAENSRELIKDAYQNYPGCYINGKEIKHYYVQQKEKEEILGQYKKYSKNKINKTLSLVKKQIDEK